MRNQEQKKSDPFYHSGPWLRLREVVLQRDRGMCVECMRLFKMGLIVKPRRAVMVHHIVPITEAPELRLVESNCESLCAMHHEQKHPERRQGGGKSVAAPDYGGDTKIRIIKV